ncbi:MAG: biotin--[acetyl-CoA-carboxylase] ligase [Rhodanobacteraceae bacterium]
MQTVLPAAPSIAAPPVSCVVLAELAADRVISGSALARRLGVTRAAVWKQIERLRASGVPIVAESGRGYRLSAPVDLLDPRTIAAEFARCTSARGASLGGLHVHWHIDSTNSELLRLAAQGAPDRLACLAEIQIAGRGRCGRAWHLPLCGGLALSLLKRFDLSIAALAGLSVAAGLAVVRALADVGVDSVRLKWPNDIVAGQRKLAGILIELGGDALGPCHAVIGVGLNVRLNDTAAIDQPCIDLAALAPDGVPERNRMAAALLRRLIDALEIFANKGLAAFSAEYARYDALAGKRVRVCGPGAMREGVACGIDARGALRVEDGNGVFSVDAGTVSVRDIE